MFLLLKLKSVNFIELFVIQLFNVLYFIVRLFLSNCILVSLEAELANAAF